MKKWLIFLLTTVYILFPEPVSAHAFGVLYNLPVPFWLYLYGAAAALIVSFLIIGYFINQTNRDLSYPKLNLSKWSLFKALTTDWFIGFLKIVSVLFFLLTILTGLFGANSSFLNFNMTFFWIIFLLGLTYLTALIGDLYLVINPWRIIIEWGENFSGTRLEGILRYHKKISYWPSFILYFILIWIELFGTITPFKLSLVIVQYTLLNFLGAFIFGKNNWFEYCEFFGVFFRLIAKIAPIEYKDSKFYLRPPFVGLVKELSANFSLLLFILFMLSSTAYDGFHSTLPWIRFSLTLSQLLEPLLGDGSYQVVQRIGLLLSPFTFLAIYLILVGFMKILTKSRLTVQELALKFAFSLIPIALAYNVAHYYTLLLTQGQEIIRLISDPFGFGWNLFGTGDYTSNLGVVDAGFVWHSQVAIILIGHIAAVYLAHLISLSIFPTHRKAVVSQFPMLILMVIYTTLGLWILSQPIRGGM